MLDYHSTNTSFNLEPRTTSLRFQPVIDHLFSAAAKRFKENLVGIILSGMLGDGAKGLKDIYLNHGQVWVQSPATVSFREMPYAALAKEAIYSKNSFRRAMTETQREMYFVDTEDNRLKLVDNIRDLVDFHYLDLNDGMEIRKMRDVDFVFCRNVMIYFDNDMKKRVLRSLYGVITHGSFFFLGEAESLHGISSSFKVEHFSGAFAYKK